MCRRTEEVGPTVGLPRHRHFVGFFNVPVLHRHGTTLFIRWFRHTAQFSRLLRSRWGCGGHILDLTPQALRVGGGMNSSFLKYDAWTLIERYCLSSLQNRCFWKFISLQTNENIACNRDKITDRWTLNVESQEENIIVASKRSCQKD